MTENDASGRPISRRSALRLGALTVGVPSLLGASATVAAAAAAPARASAPTVTAARAYPPGPPVPASWVVTDFPLDQVVLSSGSLFAEHRDLMLEFAANYPADNMLYNFRANAGLPNPAGARPVGGWDTPTGNLRGHSTGHFMTLLAQAYAGGAGDAYKDELDYLVTALGQCQDALNAQVGQPAPPPPPVSWGPGKFGGALTLSGTGQYVELPAGLVASLTDFTVATWVNPAANTEWSRIFDFGTGTTAYMFLTVNAGTGPRFSITTSGSGGEQQLNYGTRLPVGTWSHVAVTLSGGTATLYVNGTAVASNASVTLTPASLGSTGNTWIGRSQFGDPDLDGSVDEFQVYSRALSAAEVASLTTSAGGSPGGGDVAWYHFDETSGNTAADSSPAHHDATVVTTSTGAPGPSHAGYLAAYPETQFIELEQYATYPTIWAPWYTCHMIMRGLLDAYRLTGNQQALTIACGMADWAYSRLAHLPRTQLDNMWKIYIAGEYNAMPVVLAELSAITGNQDYLVTAECFVNTYLFVAAIGNVDILDGEHANQHIPQYQGYLRIFDYARATDYYTRPDYYTAAANFWDQVVPHRIYVDGGMAGVGEIFGARDVIAGTIGVSNAEGCPLYNMLKLSRSLFFHDPDPKYMQYFERGLYGQIISRRQDAHSQSDPLVTYFLPVDPGAVREYAGNLGDCDGGTGPEDATKFQESIYFRSVDGSALYVNLYMASVLNWRERGFTVEQVTDYPRDPSGAVTLKVSGQGRLDIKLRVPYWVQRGFTVRVNGQHQRLDAVAGQYVTLSREWHPGDTIAISMPFSLRMERTLDQPQTQAIAYGPIPLVAQSASESYLELGFCQDFGLTGDLSDAFTPTSDPMTFTTNGYTFAPFYNDDTNPYHVYFHRSEPRIVFGSVDSGVANPADSGGLTFLDRLWAQAPFPGDGQFRRAVSALAGQWTEAGLLTAAEQQAVVAAAARARLSS
ncbi:MAG TPA: beta-L-arabinofuranosidase domain-containing protein [Trebonia sp.]|nr:beta-L-arabinofuranosidase domain-containing protein [Trebonia sp.]